jgi:hypothetical protein
MQIPVLMADPPSSAISNWNPPRETGTYILVVVCRISPSMTSMIRADLTVRTPSHDHLRPVCLTERFISYEMRYAATP